MLQWIESQSIVGIGLLVFGLCYALTIAVFAAAVILSRHALAKQLKGVSPVTLTPLAVILALLFAFLSSRVWTNVDRAGEHVGREASALREVLMLASGLPPDVRTSVRAAVTRHLRFIITEDWPAMGKGQANLKTAPVGVTEAITAALSFVPAHVTEQLAQERTLMALQQAFESRRSRIHLSQQEIAPIQWGVIVALAILILMTIALVHLDNRPAMTVAMAIFSTAIAVCLILLLAYDRPFAVGGVTMSPTLFQEIIPD